jgi:hypothetical protein
MGRCWTKSPPDCNGLAKGNRKAPGMAGGMNQTSKIFEDPGSELEAVAHLIQRLRPDWKSGEEFYALRSEAIGRLRTLARVRNGVAWPRENSTPRSLVRIRVVERIRVVLLPRRLAKPPRPRFPKPPSMPGQRSLDV